MISDDYKRKAGLTPDTISQTMLAFYQRIDNASDGVLKALATRGLSLKCAKGCCSCCLDDLAVTRAEAQVIIEHCQDVLKTPPRKVGACAFLDDEGACRIYSFRPYICRTHGLPLRWIDEDENGDDIEERDVCELNALDLVELDPSQCFTLGVPELQLAKMNELTFGDNERVLLRGLFKG